MLDMLLSFKSKILILLSFVYGTISGAIAMFMLFNCCDRLNLLSQLFIVENLILGTGLGFLFQILEVFCINGSVEIKANSLDDLMYYLLMGLSTGIAIALYYLYGIVTLIGFISIANDCVMI